VPELPDPAAVLVVSLGFRTDVPGGVVAEKDAETCRFVLDRPHDGPCDLVWVAEGPWLVDSVESPFVFDNTLYCPPHGVAIGHVQLDKFARLRSFAPVPRVSRMLA